MNALSYTSISHIYETPKTYSKKTYKQINTFYEEEYELQWCFINPKPQPCFNPEVLSELNDMLIQLKSDVDQKKRFIKYHAFSSEIKGIFNTGGDLALFKERILARDKAALSKYAYSCIGAIHHSCTLHQHGITEIAVVEGDALGGGFECVLSADVIIAERSTKMGLPEVLFNLFPGMGSYSLLSRRLNPKKAEEIILSGKLYSAEELYDLGIVDILVDDGEAKTAVYDYIRKENKSRNSYQALRKVKDYCNPVTWEELKSIVDIWVDAALNLSSRDLRMMERLISRQKVVHTNIA